MTGRLLATRRAATVVSLLVEAGFATAIVTLPSPPLELHAVAGSLLLGLILLALGSAIPDRRDHPRPIPRLVAALVVLVVTGATGAFLAIGTLPPAWGWLPLLLLLLLAALLVDSLRSPRPAG